MGIRLGGCGCFLVSLLIIRRYNLNEEVQSSLSEVSKKGATKKKSAGQETGYSLLFTNRYYFLLSVFLVFSVCMATFNEYTYLNAVEGWYRGEEKSITVAVSVVDAIIIIVGFLIQTFANDWIMGNLGLKVSLMIMPTILGIFTLGSMFSYFFFGGEVGTQGYFVFFTFNVMGRIFAVSLRDSLESPAFKMFFLPLSRRIRFDMQSRVEGVVNQFSTLLSGGILLVFGALRFFEVIYISYVLILAVAGVFYVVVRLFVEYKSTVYKSLERQKRELGEAAKKNENDLTNIFLRELRRNEASSTLWVLKIVERINPILLRKLLMKTLKNPHGVVRAYTYEKCKEVNVFEQLEVVKKTVSGEKDPALVNAAIDLVSHLEKSAKESTDKAIILRLSRSHATADRKRAAQLLVTAKSDDLVTTQVELIRDVNREVRLAAIVSGGMQRRPDYWSEFIGGLSEVSFSNASSSALVHVGAPAMLTVDMSFYRSNEDLMAMLRIIQILGEIGGHENIGKIWKKIDYPSKKIFSQSILSLTYNGHRISGLRAERIKIQIEENVGNIVWGLRALLEVKDKHPVGQLIVKALQGENRASQEQIFLMMGLIYDPQSVKMVRDNLEFGTADSITYALELMDLFLDDSLKHKLFPLFEDLTPEERISKLTKHYVLENFSNYGDVLDRIISRDVNCLGRWTRALAIYRLSHMKKIPIGKPLISHMFNPDYLLAQTAAYVIYKAGGDAYRRYAARIHPDAARQLDNDILAPSHESQEGAHRKLLRIERALFLNKASFFRSLSGEVLPLFADESEEKFVKKGVVFLGRGTSGEVPIYVILSGEVGVVNAQGQHVNKLGSGDVIGLNALTTAYRVVMNYRALADTHLLVITMDTLFNLGSLYPEVVNVMIAYNESLVRRGQHVSAFEKVSP